ncbi:hypothetical protein [Streptomyces sp. Ru87]|uniref:hypothetical protein n=1 Tax=Streptomyces sp. Ru87 TaxID=2044307 RepID=UPI00117EEF05|nr:hypothetical protein [Streptomyces sp. Ru87]
MNWHLLLDYIRVFIWPTTALTLGIAFRKQLKWLSQRIDSVETPVGIVTFQNQAMAIADAAAEIEDEMAANLENSENKNLPTEDNPSTPKSEQTEIFNELRNSSREFNALVELAKSDATAAILRAWGELEAKIYDVAPLSTKHSRTAPGQAMNFITTRGILPDNLVRLTVDLKELRNRVAHHDNVKITQDGAVSYVMAAHRIMDSLSLATTPQALAMKYERELLQRLMQTGFRVREGEKDDSFDFYLSNEDGSKLTGVIAKYIHYGNFDSSALERETRKIKSATVDAILVTNAPLTDVVIQYNYESRKQNGDKSDGGLPLREVVQWLDSRDDDILIRAMLRRGSEA